MSEESAEGTGERQNPKVGSADANMDANYILLVSRLERDLLSWAKRKFWVFGALISVASVLGLVTIVQQTLRLTIEAPIQEKIRSLDTETEQTRRKIEDKLEEKRKQLDSLYEKTSERIADLRIKQSLAEDSIKEAESTLSAVRKASVEIISKVGELDANVKRIDFDAKKRLDDIALEQKKVQALENDKEKFLEMMRLRVIYNFESDMDNYRASWEIRRIEGIILGLDQMGNEKFIKTKIDDFSKDLKYFDSNNGKKVVIYFKGGEGFKEQAKRVSIMLRNKGYRTDLWEAAPANVESAKADISAEFSGAKQIIDGARGGIVVAKSRSLDGEQIQSFLKDYSLFSDLSVYKVAANPDHKHLERPIPRRDYRPEDIILLYVVSETESQ